MAPPARRINLRYALKDAIALLAVVIACPGARAQVTGAFSPGVYNEPSYGPLPIRRELAEPTAPDTMERANVLQSELNDSRRPYIGNIFTYTDETKVNANNKLRTVTEGLEGGLFLNDQTQVIVDYLPTIFGSSRPTLAGQEFRATVRGQPTNRLRYFTRLGLFQMFDHKVQPGLAVIGGAGVSYALSDRLSVNVDYDRYIIGNSRLSATGLNLPISNILVGRVKANQLDFGLTLRPTVKTILNFEYDVGYYEGHHIATNPFNQFGLRVGRTVVAHERMSHLQYLQPSYQFLALGFAKDLSGFGNLGFGPTTPVAATASLMAAANRQVSQPGMVNQAGVGGYFSPQQFYLNNFRLDAGGRLLGHTFYDLGVGLGIQNFKTLSNTLSHGSGVGSANASLITRLGKHFTVEQGWYFLQASHTYARNVIYNQARYYF